MDVRNQLVQIAAMCKCPVALFPHLILTICVPLDAQQPHAIAHEPRLTARRPLGPLA